MVAKLQNGAFGKIRADVLQRASTASFGAVLECGTARVYFRSREQQNTMSVSPL